NPRVVDQHRDWPELIFGEREETGGEAFFRHVAAQGSNTTALAARLGDQALGGCVIAEIAEADVPASGGRQADDRGPYSSAPAGHEQAVSAPHVQSPSPNGWMRLRDRGSTPAAPFT